jgi:hypothetical protein
MSLPGFTAEASILASQNQCVGRLWRSSMNDGVMLAGSCTCTDPKCTWSCPMSPPGGFCRRESPTCYRECLTRDPGDPYGAQNCRCCCTGNPGHSCFYR